MASKNSSADLWHLRNTKGKAIAIRIAVSGFIAIQMASTILRACAGLVVTGTHFMANGRPDLFRPALGLAFEKSWRFVGLMPPCLIVSGTPRDRTTDLKTP
jgi:hypothetical protein